MRPRLPLIALTALLATAGPAQAAYFKAEPVDSGSALQRVGDLDLARDGTGAVAYIRRDGGVDHVFVSRLVAGTLQAPERIDGALSAAGSDPAVAASDGGKVTVVFVSGGQVYAVVRPAGAPGFSAPQLLAAAGSSPSVDMSINGVAFTSFTSPGASAADVRVARLDRDTTNYQVLPQPLDIDPARDAGGTSGASDVATSADGTAVVVWGEAGHVYGRRVFGDHVSTAPQELGVESLNGHAANPGATADPQVDIEDDSSFAWATFRETFDDGLLHTVARRLVGSLFEAPVQVDGVGFGGDASATTDVQLNGRGEGLAVTGTAAKNTMVSLLHDDTFFPPALVNTGNNVAPAPSGDFAENNDGYVAWFQGATPLTATVQAVGYDVDLAKRTVPGPGPQTELSDPALGPVDPAAGMELAVDRVGDAAAVFIQGLGDGRRLVLAGFDRPPGILNTSTTSHWRRTRRPTLAFSTSFDLWGPVTYTVQIDGGIVGTTTTTRLPLTANLADGVHTWGVTATDRRGQSTVSKPGTLRVDHTPPTVTTKVTGVRKAGRRLSVAVTAKDLLPPPPVPPVAPGTHKARAAATTGPGSGVKRVVISFGDGSRAVARKAVHAYRKRGTYTIRVTAIDKAGNATVTQTTVRIKKG